MSYRLVYLKKVPIFAARIRENNNVKEDIAMKRTFQPSRRYSNEKNIPTLQQKEKKQTRFP